MKLGGYLDRIGRVNLTTSEVSYEGINEEDALKYIGGRGLGVKYLLDNGPGIEPLSPDNILCFITGPLSGTNINMSGRIAVVTRSPLTGTTTDSHHGGWSGARLKWAGFDGLIFKGAAPKPVYAYVEDGQVELRDASDLWGKNVHETVKVLLDRYGKDTSVVAIGRAGENLVRFAAWVNENDRASGRGGTGAVGGSKNLKAVVIKAAKKLPPPADPDAFKVARQGALKALTEGPATAPGKGALSVLGTNSGMAFLNMLGALPTKNGRESTFAGQVQINGQKVKDTILVDDPTCHACPVACKKEVETGPGDFHVHMESMEYENAWGFGAYCANDNLDAIAYMSNLCNDYGMDTIEMGAALATAMEASEKELIVDRLAWGDAHKMVELVHATALRQGLGDTLAEGVARAAKAWGDPSIGMEVKGQAMSGYDPRGLKGMGVVFATSNRGACHLRGYSFTSEIGGIPYRTVALDWQGKGKVVKILQDIHAVSDSLDICKFATFSEKMDDFAAQYAAVTGVPMDADKLLEIGERVSNLERYYNNLCGFGEGSDYLPERFLKEPSASGSSTGHICELDQMLEEYYAERGWKNGVVPEAKLKAMGIV